MNEEIKEMGKFACIFCGMGNNQVCGQNPKCFMLNIDDCFLVQRLGQSLYDAGYRKTDIKTNGDNIRKLNEQNDDELANSYINAFVKSNSNNCIYYRALFTVEDFDTFDEAYEANLKWLKQDYKGE